MAIETRHKMALLVVATFVYLVAALTVSGCEGEHICTLIQLCARNQEEADRLNAESGCDNYMVCDWDGGDGQHDSGRQDHFDVDSPQDGDTDDQAPPADAGSESDGKPPDAADTSASEEPPEGGDAVGDAQPTDG